jgi:hypothetical protein
MPASGLSTAGANRVIDWSHGTGTPTAPTTPMKLRLTTTASTAAAAGTEVVGGSYVAQTVAMTAASAASSPNTSTLTYSSMPATTVVGVAEFDSNGSPFYWWFAPLAANKTTNSGDTLTIAGGAYTTAITSP